MNKKGFTLVEMLVVVSFIAIIALIAFPNLSGMLKKIDNQKYQRFLSDVFIATEAYVQANIDNYSELKEVNGKVYIYFDELIESNYLKSTTYDPKNKKMVKVEDFTVEVLLNEDKQYKYKLYEERVGNCAYEIGQVWNFEYTGSEQEFIAQCEGIYKLETWGASGGKGIYNTQIATEGYGAYATGKITVANHDVLYINVGGKGTDGNMPSSGTQVINQGGYNGGGSGISAYPGEDYGSAGGGGATHISLNKGLLSMLENKIESILIVSAGGAGGNLQWYKKGGYLRYAGGSGGGILGNSGSQWSSSYVKGLGGTQTSGGAGKEKGTFGQGGKGSVGGSGGGSGLYGGGSSGTWASAGGGSSYIGNTLLTEKVMYCYNCTESTEESTKTISTTCHSSTPTENCAKEGNGYAKITYLGK